MFFGGWTNGIAYGDTWTYNGVDWVQQKPLTSPQARADNALAFDPILKSVVLFGGLASACEDCGQGRLNDTWLWGSHNWIQCKPLQLGVPVREHPLLTMEPQKACCYSGAG